MNSKLELLKPYPFERLRVLLSNAKPDDKLEEISWSIGEPKGDPPPFVLDVLKDNLNLLGKYPSTAGEKKLREAICLWLAARFSIKENLLDPDRHVLPVAGTREALFSICQAVVDSNNSPYVVFPNPFYQIYEGAAILSGAKPYLLNLNEEDGFIPQFESVDKSIWENTSMVYICSPSNPTGSCLKLDDWKVLIELADRHDFVIASDECYSEIYPHEFKKPVGLLEAAAKLGFEDFKNCLVFHSLSKRSNLPGMRSGFVAGDSSILKKYLLYRTYHGSTLSPPVQLASIAAWKDEDHVLANRECYRQNFKTVIEVIDPDGSAGLKQADGAFYLWFKTPYDEEKFAFDLWEKEKLLVLPGSYLSRENEGVNPGEMRVRMALVATGEACKQGALRLKRFLDNCKNGKE